MFYNDKSQCYTEIMQYKINKIIIFKEYENKYRRFFERLCKIVDQTYKNIDTRRKKTRNLTEKKILRKLKNTPT